MNTGTAWFDDLVLLAGPKGPEARTDNILPGGDFEMPLEGMTVAVDFSEFDRGGRRVLDELADRPVGVLHAPVRRGGRDDLDADGGSVPGPLGAPEGRDNILTRAGAHEARQQGRAEGAFQGNGRGRGHDCEGFTRNPGSEVCEGLGRSRVRYRWYDVPVATRSLRSTARARSGHPPGMAACDPPRTIQGRGFPGATAAFRLLPTGPAAPQSLC